ncbi:Uncharacterized protein APZ42_015132 [Daphnia magna]|uniref:Uncharacterized protein n=1 Tax=Daphnia magna TaxID=35525 RepID=A0A0P5W652_9CRUS|nr:Uncharacterized protein APZ42_015132 [Daphnia magna]
MIHHGSKSYWSDVEANKKNAYTFTQSHTSNCDVNQLLTKSLEMFPIIRLKWCTEFGGRILLNNITNTTDVSIHHMFTCKMQQ